MSTRRFVRIVGPAVLAGVIAVGPAGLARAEDPLPAKAWSGIPSPPLPKGEKFEKVPTSLSGIACGPEREGRRDCLVAPDERTTVYFYGLKDGGFTLVGSKPLLVPPGKTANDKKLKTEADLEGIARDGDTYWVLGSHSTPRKPKDGSGCAPVADRQHLYRFAVDAKTGLPSTPLDADTVGSDVQRIDRLPAVLRGVEGIGSAVDAVLCADKGGFNLEGIAVAGGDMTLGLRAPLTNDNEAQLVTLDAAALVGTGDPNPKLHALALDGLAVRDLAAVPGGVLILAGQSISDDDENKRPPSVLWFWAGAGNAPKKIGTLGPLGTADDEKAKPEGLLVLDADAKAEKWRVLVICDGVGGGSPREYLFARP